MVDIISLSGSAFYILKVAEDAAGASSAELFPLLYYCIDAGKVSVIPVPLSGRLSIVIV